MDKKIILIGGAPTVGKSYIARKLAEKLKLPWISTDDIREQMREIVRRSDYPNLFLQADSSGEKAVEFLTTHSPKEIVEEQNKESEDVWKGVKAFIDTDYVWKSFIVEGVAILPNLIANLKVNKIIKTVFLINDDAKRIREIIFTRGLWDAADKYPDNVKEKEIEWVIEFNNYVENECKRYRFPLVHVGHDNDTIAEIVSLTK